MKIKLLALSLTTVATVGMPCITLSSCFGSGTKETIKVTNITISTPAESDNIVSVNHQMALTVSVSPSDATNKEITWASSDTEIATVDQNGQVTGISDGTVIITATAKDGSGVAGSVTITVKTIDVEKVVVYAATVQVNQKTGIYAAAMPENASNRDLTYKMADTSIATIDSEGYITGVKEGTTSVTATNPASGKAATAKVTVTKEIKLVTKISIDSVSALDIDETVQLNPIVYPSNATNKILAWSTSNASIATVDDNGTVTAHGYGSATITASAVDGSNVKGTVTINVVDKTLPNETWKDYIFNRTFSLCGSSSGTCWGTGWILSDYTPNDPTDYKYYVATNMHVQKGIESCYAYPNNMYFGCYDGKLTATTDYVPFGSGNVSKISDSTFTYDGTTKIKDSEGNYGLKGIDLSISVMDFANCTNTSYTGKSRTIAKDKLDLLNKYTASNKPITQFASKTSGTTGHTNVSVYTGGYPVNSSWKACWEYHDFDDEGLSLYYMNNSTVQNYNYQHSTDDYSSSPIIDCAPQYMMAEEKISASASWMSGGASGSMLIGNFGTTDLPTWKVVGIYWGGWGGTYFYPCYSVLNSDWKDYISSYITVK